MKLSQSIIDAISEDRELQLKIASALKCTQDWVQRLAKANKVNGPLTTIAVLTVLQQELDTTIDGLLMSADEEELALTKDSGG